MQNGKFQHLGRIFTRLNTSSKPSLFLQTARAMASGSEGSHKFSNRLVKEKSPYLLQHAHNPVDWYPWGEEAFKVAKKENKLIFLSVGYSTCHWCHVMERESFENPDIGKLMNEHFVNIKVDREERPDVDKMYMTFVQAISGGGGWPMSVFLSPDLQPITGGTYFPPADKWGRPGFPTILKYISSQWEEKPDEVKKQGKMFTEAILKMSKDVGDHDSTDLPKPDSFHICFAQMKKQFDPKYGGIGKEPKFPQPTNFDYLLRFHHHNQKKDSGKDALEIVEKSLICMERGGIHDFVFQGFHRYSTDQRWHIPHFEKMLYDQAQLASLYADAYTVTKKPLYAHVVRDILSCVNRDLSHLEGGFFSAEDADSYPTEGSSEKREGAFCVWGYEEIQELLSEAVKEGSGTKLSELFSAHFQVKDGGNVPPFSDPHGELKDMNVLIAEQSVAETGKKFNLDETETIDALERARKILFQARLKRPKPHLDSKIITSWNGLMISGFARAGMALGEEEYINRAERAALFIRAHLTSREDRASLLRSCYTKNPAQPTVVQISSPIEGFLDDYAFLISALLDLFEATQEVDWLKWAEELQKKADELFWDSETDAGYFMSRVNDPNILVRMKEDQDGAEPSGNSVSAENLLRLADILDEDGYRARAKKILVAFKERLDKIPMALPKMLSSLYWLKNSATQIVIVGPKGSPEAKQLIATARDFYLPESVLVLLEPHGQDKWLRSRVRHFESMSMIDEKPTAYVCRNFTCSLPVHTKEDLIKQLLGDSK